MTLLDLLRAHWELWGLDAPKFAWIAAAGLLLAPIAVLLYLFRAVRSETAILSETAERVNRLRSRKLAEPGAGLSGAAYKELAEIFHYSPTLADPWNRYIAVLLTRQTTQGDLQTWSSESAESAFTDSAVFEGRLNRGFYASLPGIVTGIGLLFTFLAILVALLDVRINAQTNQIEGLPLLIEGLSGKFVSSIAALFSATIFLLVEKPLAHRLSKARLQLIASLDAMVPRLSAARILAELHDDMGAVADLVDLTKKATTEQLELSQTQAKASMAVLRQFMIQLNETAAASISHMAATFTGLGRDLTENMTSLTAELATTLQNNTSQSNAALTLAEKLDGLSQSAERLEPLIEQLQIQAKVAQEAEDGLIVALGLLDKPLHEFASLNSALSEITSDVNEISERLQDLTHSLEKLKGIADGARA